MRSQELKQKLLIVGVVLIALALLMFIFGSGDSQEESTVKSLPLPSQGNVEPVEEAPMIAQEAPVTLTQADLAPPLPADHDIRLLTEMDTSDLQLRSDVDNPKPSETVVESAPAEPPLPEPLPVAVPEPVAPPAKPQPKPQVVQAPPPKPKPQPIEVKQAAAQTNAPPPKRVSVSIEPPKPRSGDPIGDILKRNSNIHDTQWVLDQSDSRHTIQLLASYGYKDILKFARRIDSSIPVAIYRTRRSGRDWYALVYGVYDSMGAAKSDIQNLPEEWQSFRPWPRSMASLKKTIQGH